MQPSSFNEPNVSAGSPVSTGPQPAGLPSVAPVPAVDATFQAPIGQNAPQPAPSTVPAAGPDLADDGDLIEKEWVSQVKRIVSATANDPYEQNVQFTRLKAEYMQKRYGKQIKVED